MNITAFIEYLNQKNSWHIDAGYYAHIDTWRKWWRGYLPEIHDLTECDALGTCKRRLASLRMAKKVCADWANLLLNDRTTLNIKDKNAAVYLLGEDARQNGGLLRALNFWPNANALVEQAYWSGTGAFVLSVEGATQKDGALTNENGTARLVLDYDPACCILPVRVEHGVILDAAFASACKVDGKPAVYLQTHTHSDAGEYIIKNEWFAVSDESDSATPVFTPLSAQGNVAETLTLPAGTPPWFSTFSPAAVKNIDGGMGLGMAVYSEALDELQMVDLAFDNYRQDIRLGGKKIFYDRSIVASFPGPDGKEHFMTPDMLRRQQFFSLPPQNDAGGYDQKEPLWREYNPALRCDENHRAVQDALNLLSAKCGLGSHYYLFEQSSVRTATEYTGSRQDFVASANKNQLPIEAALVQIARAMLWGAKHVLGADVDPNTEISVVWDDSYITDAETRLAQLREDALNGMVPRWKYLTERYGVNEETAKAWASEASAENDAAGLQFGAE